MQFFKRAALVGGLATAAFLALPASPAHAAKVPFIYNTGEDIFVAGDGSLPAPFDKEPELSGAEAGYKCEIWGVVWAYFSVKNCKPVAFKGDTFWEEPELSAAIAKAHPENTMKLGMWKGYGKFPLGLGLLGVLGLVAWSKLKGGKDEDEQESNG
jgi:hypothetical protein